MSLNNTKIEDLFSLINNDNILKQDIIELNLLGEPYENHLINMLNKEISCAKTRLEGLEKLILFIDCCPDDVILTNAFNWIHICIIQQDRDHMKDLKLRITGKIIENAYKSQEFSKKMVSDYIAKIVDSCLIPHETLHETDAALTTLAICMKRYASWFTSYKQKIEAFILKFFDNESETLVEKAAVIFLYLQQVGGAGIEGFNHKQNFSSAFHKICVMINKLFDVFFEHVVEFEQYEESEEPTFTFSTIPCDSEVFKIIAKRIKNCLKFLKIMLLKGFPVAKEIKPLEILNIIGRGTAVHICLTSDGEKSVQDFQHSLFLINIQEKLLQLLRILLIWLQNNALPFAFSISKIVIDCLNRSQNCKCFEAKSHFTEMVYKTLSYWITISKCSLHQHFQEILVSCILNDITQAKKEITLNINDIRNKSTKFKNKALQEKILASGHLDSSLLVTTTEARKKEQKCLFALDTLKQLLFYSYADSDKLPDIYSSVINKLIDLNTSRLSYTYLNQECQTKLYEVLVAFYDQNSPTLLPPLQLTIDLLIKGMSSTNETVRLCCEQGLNVLEKICQPICPSLYSPEMFHLKLATNNGQIINIDENQMDRDLQTNDTSEIWTNENANEYKEVDSQINNKNINEHEESNLDNVDNTSNQLSIEFTNVGVMDSLSVNSVSFNVDKIENGGKNIYKFGKTLIVDAVFNNLNPNSEIDVVSEDIGNINGIHIDQQKNEGRVKELRIQQHLNSKKTEQTKERRLHSFEDDKEERPSKVSKLDIDDITLKKESQDTNEDFSDSFVDEVKDY